MTRLIWMLVGVVVVLAACGGDGASTTEAGADPTATLAPGASEDDAEEPTATTSAAEPTATAAPAPTVPTGPTDLLDVGVPEMTVTVPADAGPKPVVSWTPIDGADRYYVAVWDGDGRPYWSWWGADTSVVVGGGSGASSGQTAILQAPATMRVYAFDAADTMVAVSDKIPIT